MSVKCFISSKAVRAAATVSLLGIFAQAAFAQKTPAAGTHITVSKTSASGTNVDGGQFRTIQEAVNVAKPGQIIEILDESVYQEQVTIDGRESHPWGYGVVGGKNDITIRYVPTPGVTARPTITWQDTYNRWPQTCMQAQNATGDCGLFGDAPGCGANFETNGAVRILRTSGIKIEGIVIDGGGQSPFGYDYVWSDTPCDQPSGGCNNGSSACPLVHGNAAVAVAISNNIQIRDCELRNAVFGIYVADRNTGGVFGNPNPEANDFTVPLSGFGKTGNHLFEYNRIHRNRAGIYFQSLWDLGTTVRYNLIYENYTSGTSYTPGGEGDKLPGGIVFDETDLTPVAIYNNTFYQNAMDIVGRWKIGYQHLIFNNIFSRPNSYGSIDGSRYMHDITRNFPYRLKHNLFAATDQAPYALSEDGCNNAAVALFQQSFNITGSCIQPGALLTGVQLRSPPNIMSTVNFPEDHGNKWLETAAAGMSYPSLFKSQIATDPDFLVPDWTRSEVQEHVQNAGWTESGVIDQGGLPVSIGAVQYNSVTGGTGRRPVVDGHLGYARDAHRIRIKPFSVVTLSSGTNATASLVVDNELGSVNNMTVKYARWIAPLPDNNRIPSGDNYTNTQSWGNTGLIVPANAITPVTVTSGTIITEGDATRFSFSIPPMPSANALYGFLEIVLEGRDASGNTVISDVGFLPYRSLDYILQFERVATPLGGTYTGADATVVLAGEPMYFTVQAMRRSSSSSTGWAAFDGGGGTNLVDVTYSLNETASRMWRTLTPVLGNPLVSDSLRSPSYKSQVYTVYFTKAGEEIISGAGLWCITSDCATAPQRLTFFGDLALTVLPAGPANVKFASPISNSQLPDGVTPTGLSGEAAVDVVVTDRWGNPVDQAVAVQVKSLQPDIGEVGVTIASPPTQTVSTNSATGIAAFTAWVTNGNPGDIFDMAASIENAGGIGGAATDTAAFRIARAADGLRILYQSTSDTTWREDFESNYGVDTIVSYWVPVYIKIVSNEGDAVLMSRNGFVCVTPDNPQLILSQTMSGGTPGASLSVPLVNGLAQLYVTSSDTAADAGLYAIVKADSEDCDGRNDNSITAASRSGLTFGDRDVDVSVLTSDRIIPTSEEAAAVITPVNVSASEFTAGPNVVRRGVARKAQPRASAVTVYRTGTAIGRPRSGKDNVLTVYDATGNVVNKITISDNAPLSPPLTSSPDNGNARRVVGKWDLKDAKGRPVPEGTYLLRGAVRTVDGKRARVSVLVSVR